MTGGNFSNKKRTITPLSQYHSTLQRSGKGGCSDAMTEINSEQNIVARILMKF